MDEEEFSSRAERRRAGSHRKSATSSGASGSAGTHTSSGVKKPLAALLALVLLGGGGCAAWKQFDSAGESAQGSKNGEDAGNSCAASRTPVAVSPALSKTLGRVLEGYRAPKDDAGCDKSFTVTTVKDTDFVNQIASGSTPAMVWLADSQVSAAQASSAAKQKFESTPVAASPVVLTGSKEALGAVGTPPSWETLLNGASAPKVPDVTNNPAGQLAVACGYRALSETSAGRSLLGHWASVSDAGKASTVSTAQSSTAPNREVTIQTEASAAAAKVPTMTALPGGSPLVKVPVVKLSSGDAATDDAYKRLTTYLTSPTAQQKFAQAGWRNASGKVVTGAQATDSTGLGAQTVPGAPAALGPLTIAKDVQPQEAANAVTTFSRAASPLRLTTVVDVSGSMKAEVNGVTRIDAVRQAALTALDVLPPSTSLALWEFSTARDGNTDYRVLSPMVPISDSRNKAELTRLANQLPRDLGGGTGLYDTIWAAYEQAQKDYQAGQFSTVAILTDGKNDDATGGLSLDELTAKIEAAKDPKRPVAVSPVAIGPDTDLQVLQHVAELTGGELYRAKQPSDIPAVLAQGTLNRH